MFVDAGCALSASVHLHPEGALVHVLGAVRPGEPGGAAADARGGAASAVLALDGTES